MRRIHVISYRFYHPANIATTKSMKIDTNPISEEKRFYWIIVIQFRTKYFLVKETVDIYFDKNNPLISV